MNMQIVVVLAIFLVLTLAVKIMCHPKIKGWFGEQMVAGALRKLDPLHSLDREAILDEIEVFMKGAQVRESA